MAALWRCLLHVASRGSDISGLYSLRPFSRLQPRTLPIADHIRFALCNRLHPTGASPCGYWETCSWLSREAARRRSAEDVGSESDLSMHESMERNRARDRTRPWAPDSHCVTVRGSDGVLHPPGPARPGPGRTVRRWGDLNSQTVSESESPDRYRYRRRHPRFLGRHGAVVATPARGWAGPRARAGGPIGNRLSPSYTDSHCVLGPWSQ